ncbi:MAG: hypothetical protein QM662_12000, partial [Gordonia sp. (in: high G+C Gram-positive bacteria)]
MTGRISANVSNPVSACRPTVAVCGRGGTGRDTMARALRDRLGVDALGPGEDTDTLAAADLLLYLLVGTVRAADVELLAHLPADRTVVVLGKADTCDDPDAAAAAAATVLGRPVLPVSALLACAEVTAAEWDFLRELAAAGEQMPSLSGRFLTGAERTLRRRLLRRLDRLGIEIALDVAADRAAGVDDLTAILQAESGIAGLGARITAMLPRVAAARARDRRAELEYRAAAGADRDRAERLLRVAAV